MSSRKGVQDTDTAYGTLPLHCGGSRDEAVRLSHRERLRTGIGWLDSVVGGFRPGEVVLIDGPGRYLAGLLSGICVDAAAGCGGDVVFIDGGNSVDPYGIARISRLRGLDPHDVLPRIHVARAFTAHQMAALVNDGLEPALDRTGASAVIVSCLPGPFLDPDMGRSEALHLVRRSMDALRRAAAERGTVTVVSSPDSGFPPGCGALARTVEAAPDRLIRLRRTDIGMSLRVPGRAPVLHRHCPANGQAILDRYAREASYGEDGRDI